jgi:hypothetical protein
MRQGGRACDGSSKDYCGGTIYYTLFTVSEREGYKRWKVVANHRTGCLVYGIRWKMDFHGYEPLLRRSG